MKLTIGGYDVEINVKDELSKEANEQDTIHFLNEISLYLQETKGSFAKEAYKYGVQIYNHLEKMGAYK